MTTILTATTPATQRCSVRDTEKARAMSGTKSECTVFACQINWHCIVEIFEIKMNRFYIHLLHTILGECFSETTFDSELAFTIIQENHAAIYSDRSDNQLQC